MRKFLIKAKIPLLVLAFGVIFMIMVAGNYSLIAKKPVIEEAIEKYFTHEISVGSVYYLFPNRILFNNIEIKHKDHSVEKSSFVLSRMTMRFAFWDLLINGVFGVSKVTLYPSSVSYYALSQFFEKNFQSILQIIRNSPGNDVTIRVKESLLDFDRKGRPDYIAMEVLLVIEDDIVRGTGFFRTDQYRFSDEEGVGVQRVAQGWPLWYKFKGRSMPDGLEVDELIFKSGVLHSKLRGGIRGGQIKVNGFAFMNTAKKEFDHEEYVSSRYFKNFPDDKELSNIDTYVLDIDSQASLDLPLINVEKLNFTLNNTPVALTGSISLSEIFTVEVRGSLLGGNISGRKNPFFEKIDMSLSSTWKEGVLNTNGEAKIDFVKRKEGSLSPDEVKINFKDLSFYFDQHKRPKFDLSYGDIAYWTNANEHKLSIRDVEIAANTKMEGLKVVEVDAPFYDGSLNGRIWIDSSQAPTKITSNIILTDVDTDALEELLVHFGKFNGRMSSKISFTNIPQLDLSGDIMIYDGTMTDFNFFNWLSDSFRLPDLRAITFGKASAQFTINKKHAQLRDIYLQSDDVDIRGYFTLDGKSLVSSKLSLALSQSLLRKSSKFKPVLKMFADDPSDLGFDFQLSGNLGKMNFQWLTSDAKQKIQKRIPDFIERMIERDVDAMME